MKQESVMVTRRLLLPQPPGDVGTSRCRSASSTNCRAGCPQQLPAPVDGDERTTSNIHHPLEVNLECRQHIRSARSLDARSRSL
jgi:hypothetical protein